MVNRLLLILCRVSQQDFKAQLGRLTRTCWASNNERDFCLAILTTSHNKKSVHDRPAMIYLRKMTLVIYLWIRGWHKNSQENHEPFNVHILTHLLDCCDSHCNTFVSYMQQWESSVRFGESYHISHQHTYRGSRKKAVGVGAKNIPKESKVCGQRQKSSIIPGLLYFSSIYIKSSRHYR